MKESLVESGWRSAVFVGLLSGAFRTRFLAAAAAILCVVLLACTSRASEPPPSARTFETLTVRGTTYSRVTIVDITKRHVSFRSAQGFATVLLEDLEPEVITKIRAGVPNLPAAEQAVKPASDAAKAGKAMPVHARGTPTEQEDEDGEDDAQIDAPPIQWGVRTVIAASIFGVGALGIFVGQVWLICVGFHKSVLWGVILLFGSFFAQLMFCCSHWDVAKRPTLLTLAFALVVAVGAKMWVG